MELSVEHRLTEVEERAKSNQRRIEKLETSTEALNRLAASMEVMAEKQERVALAVNELDGKVTALESRPARRWDDLVSKLMLVGATALFTWVLGQMGLPA